MLRGSRTKIRAARAPLELVFETRRALSKTHTHRTKPQAFTSYRSKENITDIDDPGRPSTSADPSDCEPRI